MLCENTAFMLTKTLSTSDDHPKSLANRMEIQRTVCLPVLSWKSPRSKSGSATPGEPHPEAPQLTDAFLTVTILGN